MLTSHIAPHKGVISLMWLPAQKFDLLIVSDSEMGLMPAQSEELTSQGRTPPHSLGLCSLATWEAQMPPGELGPRARSLVWITGKLGGPSQLSLEENPGNAWYKSSMDSASPCPWSSAFFHAPISIQILQPRLVNTLML